MHSSNKANRYPIVSRKASGNSSIVGNGLADLAARPSGHRSDRVVRLPCLRLAGVVRGAILGAILAGASGAHGATTDWTGLSSANWSDPGNWTNGVPSSTDSVAYGLYYGTNVQNHSVLNVSLTIANLALDDGTIKEGSNPSDYSLGISSTNSAILSLTNGLTDSVASAMEYSNESRISAPVSLVSNNTWTIGADCQLGTGSIALGGNLTTVGEGVNEADVIEIGGSITGGGSLIDQAAILHISGTGNNYSGGTILDSGSFVVVESSLGTGSVTNGGTVSYAGGTAGSSTITNNTGGVVLLSTSAAATNATIVNNSGGEVDNSYATSGVSIGSLSGSGAVFLGSQTLTLGGLNGADTISGKIQDGGVNNGAGGSLVKVGSGTLTLSGANNYTGSTTVNAGMLILAGSGNYGTTLSNAAGATLDIESGTVAYARALNGGTTNISGGNVTLADSSSGGILNITGGTVGHVIVGDPATVNIYGGTFSSGIENADPTDSIVNLFGSNFTLTNATKNGSNVDWTLMGTLSDGEMLDTQYVEDGTTNTAAPQGISFNGAASAPEPGALALLLGFGVPSAFAAARRRKRSRA